MGLEKSLASEIHDVPVSRRQIVYLAAMIAIPLALAVSAIFFAPLKPGQTERSTFLGLGIVGLIVLIVGWMLMTAVLRHAIALHPDALVVKHSMYTFHILRSEISAIKVTPIDSVGQLGLALRKNGIAAFAYYSGWFWGRKNELIFCAISTYPVYLLTFDGTAKCRQLALSASPAVAERILQWAAEQS
ncbi:hypothetical protein [Janthinobacterium sp.]|uniref:hypothetical protein n=1 Tax=Janthinobacterium sp. TaxID=1871054 RepID=UPI00260948B4|nr:hypothetical protein [Janthinobacterium sp.]